MTTAETLSKDDTLKHQHVLHPGSRKLFRYWEGLRAERKCPERSEFNLHQVRDLIGNLFIWDFDARTGSYRYRLAGTGITSLFRGELTGQDALAGWDNFERKVISQVLNIAQIQLQPGLVRMRLFAEFNQIIGAEALILPIRKSDGAGKGKIQLVGGIFPFTNPDQLAYSRIVDRQLVTSRTIWTEHMEEAQEDCSPGPLQHQSPPEPSERPRLRVIVGGLADETKPQKIG